MKESVSGCSRRPGAPTHASKSWVERGCWKPKPMPRGCPPAHLLSPLGCRSCHCPSPGLCWCAKPWCKRHPPESSGSSRPRSSSAATPGLVTVTHGQGSNPEPSCQAGKRLQKLLQHPLVGSPPAGLRAHTPVDMANVTCWEDATSPTSVSLAAGWRRTEQLPEVSGNGGKVLFLELGKVRY